MLKSIKPAHKEEVDWSVLEYQYIDLPSAGFIFDCVDGKPVFACKEAAQNYIWCREHPDLVIDKGIHSITYQIQLPAATECECGEQFYLYDSYYGCCQCAKCGKWYNVWEQELNPPDQWLEDLEPD